MKKQKFIYETELGKYQGDSDEDKETRESLQKRIKECEEKINTFTEKLNNIKERISKVSAFVNPFIKTISDFESKVQPYTNPEGSLPLNPITPPLGTNQGPGPSSGSGFNQDYNPNPSYDPVYPVNPYDPINPVNPVITPSPTLKTTTPTSTTPTPTRITPTPTRMTPTPTATGTEIVIVTETVTIIVTPSPTSYAYETSGGAGFFQNSGTDETASMEDLDLLEEADLDETVNEVEQIPVMNSVKPIDKPISKGNSTLATIAGIGAAGAVAGGLAYVAKKKKDEDSDELDDFIADDEELSDDALEPSTVEDKDWLYDVGLDIPSMDSKNNDIS